MLYGTKTTYLTCQLFTLKKGLLSDLIELLSSPHPAHHCAKLRAFCLSRNARQFFTTKTATMKEKWFEFTRFNCIEGYIDYFSDDAAQDPNRPVRAGYRLNATRAWFRLSGESNWFSDRDFKSGFFIAIRNSADEMSAKTIWLEYKEVFDVRLSRKVFLPDEEDIEPGLYRALIRDGFAHLQGVGIAVTMDWVTVLERPYPNNKSALSNTSSPKDFK